jgi:regulator of protease activity HflC (stomatin/prohibitin superfamily)
MISHRVILHVRISYAARNALRNRLVSRKFAQIIDLDDDSDKWPISVMNTGINQCPQGQRMIIERNGKFSREIDGGNIFFAIPFYDRIKYVIDMRERAIRVQNTSAITRDQARIDVSCVVYCRFTDAQKAAYGSINPLYSIRQHTQTAVRYLIAETDFDHIIGSNKSFSNDIKETIETTAADWGFTISRCEIMELTPHKAITEAIDKNATAELEGKHQLLQAEYSKKISEIESTAEKLRIQLAGEAIAKKIEYEARARKETAILKVSCILVTLLTLI